MKNLSLILNGVLIVAVGILYYLHFSTPKAAQTDVKLAKVEGEAKPDTVVVTEKVELPDLNRVSSAKIAYVNLEELNNKLSFIKREQGKMEQKFKDREKALQDRQLALQEEAQKFQQSAAMMTEQGIREKQEKLLQTEQELYTDMQEFQRDAIMMEQEINKNILTKLDNYLKDLSKEKNYTYIFTYDKGNASTIVFANDSLDITRQVIQGMNARYK